jgi:hypothetical protein
MKTQINITIKANSNSLLFSTTYISKPNTTYLQYELHTIYFNIKPTHTATWSSPDEFGCTPHHSKTNCQPLTQTDNVTQVVHCSVLSQMLHLAYNRSPSMVTAQLVAASVTETLCFGLIIDHISEQSWNITHNMWCCGPLSQPNHLISPLL